MISGVNEEELELAEARMNIMLATNYTTENPGPLAIIDKYHDKEIERLNNIINELEKELEQNIAVNKANNIEQPDNPEWYIKWNCYLNILDKLKELKEGK